MKRDHKRWLCLRSVVHCVNLGTDNASMWTCTVGSHSAESHWKGDQPVINEGCIGSVLWAVRAWLISLTGWWWRSSIETHRPSIETHWWSVHCSVHWSHRIWVLRLRHSEQESDDQSILEAMHFLKRSHFLRNSIITCYSLSTTELGKEIKQNHSFEVNKNKFSDQLRSRRCLKRKFLNVGARRVRYR